MLGDRTRGFILTCLLVLAIQVVAPVPVRSISTDDNAGRRRQTPSTRIGWRGGAMSAGAESSEVARGKRVLSIQSHVVSGYVGNSAAVFPLQLLGFDVDVVNSVQFSSHTGYPFGYEGEVLDGRMLQKLIDGLERNGLLSGVGNVLTGFIGSESFLSAVADTVKKVKSLNSRCRYICDPVLGDNGKFYVPEGLAEIYKKDLLPLADVVTPNQFEVEQLTGVRVQSLKDAQAACRILHDMGVSLVLITSIVFPDASGDGDNCDGSATASTDPLAPPSKDVIGIFASRRHPPERRNECADEQYVVYSPKLPGHFTGTGDVCAALFLAWTAESNYDENKSVGSGLASALERVAGTMNAMVQRTSDATIKRQPSCLTEKAQIVASRELKLIQSRDDILRPPTKFQAIRVHNNSE